MLLVYALITNRNYIFGFILNREVVNDQNPNIQVKMVNKASIMKGGISFLIIAFVFTACQSANNEENQTKEEIENTSLALDRKILDLVDDKKGETFSMEVSYPKDWKTEMASNNVFHASENPDSVTDGYANNFHAIVYNDSLNHDIKRLSNNFIIAEQNKFRKMHFEVINSENVKGQKGINFQMDQIRIWGNMEDTLFTISALAKIKSRIVHLNFYSNYEERKSLEILARDIVTSVRIRE